jgi:nuclear transport factor 2 (NTF2) superfamily protein
MTEARPPFPPFELGTAIQKVQAAEDAWNSRDPQRVSLAHPPDSVWRNRDEFITGRDEIIAFLTRKWERELDYVLRKSLWGFRRNRMAVRFQYEWHDAGTTSTCSRRRLSYICPMGWRFSDWNTSSVRPAAQ